MNIIFRTDASLQIGTGHVVRCLTLADTLRTTGAHCYFVCREHEGNLIAQIQQRNFLVSVLPVDTNGCIFDDAVNEKSSSHEAWLGVTWVEDVAQTKSVINGNEIDWIIIDHYALDVRWEKELRPLCKKLMIIDDLADRRHVCDLLLDQNIGRTVDDYRGLVPDDCIILAGPQYALIREEFWKLRYKEKNVNKSNINLLVFFGGIDSENYTGWAIDLLNGLELANICVDVVVGEKNLNIDQIKSACEDYGYTCHVQTNRMAEIMHRSDLYIGAGGGAILERIMMKLPSVTIAVADNQIEFLKIFSQMGASVYLGSGKLLSDTIFKQAILLALSEVNTLAKNCEVLCEEFFSDRAQLLQKLSIKQLE
jgi:UDP-2,4-diacetamido-2,4,6-trideoxy-beta-L-altropyranose hydrolase